MISGIYYPIYNMVYCKYIITIIYNNHINILDDMYIYIYIYIYYIYNVFQVYNNFNILYYMLLLLIISICSLKH